MNEAKEHIERVKPFTKLIRCPACDAPYGWLSVKYCAGRLFCPDDIEGPHLHKACSRCGYTYLEQPNV